MSHLSVVARVSFVVGIMAALASYFQLDPHRLLSQGNMPYMGTTLSKLHNYVIDLNRKLSFSPQHHNAATNEEILFSEEELSRFNGEEGSPGIYLAIFGKVYDVTRGKKHYGAGGSYHSFAGRDASRAFVTGDFSEAGTTDDVMGLSSEDLKSIQDWSLFYNNEYTYKGKVVGRYYTSTGERTDYYNKVEKLIQQAVDENAAKNADYIKYPPCNVEWTPETGSKVWCSNRSGGIERDWSGVPRKYYKPGSESSRCACIQFTEEMRRSPQRKGNVEEYEDCSPESESCYVRGDS